MTSRPSFSKTILTDFDADPAAQRCERERQARREALDALHEATAIYTAQPVVDELLDRIHWPHEEDVLVEPSCGDGAFLDRALARLLHAQPALDEAGIARRLEGWELHPGAAGAARSTVASRLHAHGWPYPRALDAATRIVHNADWLTEGPRSPRYHVIVGNPPYLRYANVPRLLRAEYEGIVPKRARSDLLHSFLDRCTEVLHPQGEVAFVTADRWLFNVSAANLRAGMGERFGIHHLKRLDAASAFYRPKTRRQGTPPRVHPVAVVLGPSSRATIPLGRAAVYPDAPPKGEGERTLNDVATVRLAPWLGPEGIFVIDAETAARFPKECLVPAVDTDDIVDGWLRPARRYALRTRPDEPPPQEILTHLRAALKGMPPRGRQDPDWLPPEPWHNLRLDQEALLVPRIAKTLRPVRLPAGTLPINHNLSIVTKGALSLDEIEQALQSERAHAWIRACAPRLENDYRSITTTILRQVPIE